MNNDPLDDGFAEDAIRAYGLRKEVAGVRSAMLTVGKPKRRMLPMIFKVAASVLILLVVGAAYIYFAANPASLYKQAFVDYRESSLRGSETDSISKKFQNAYQLLQQEKTQAAVATFTEIANQRNGKTFVDDAEYYLALSYLKMNWTSEAYRLFKKIHDEPNHLYHDEVSGWMLFKLRVLTWKK